MNNIYHNSRKQGHNYESFKSQLIQICNQHKEENRAMAFAFILYNNMNPELSKVLHDDEYWNSLDEIFGNFLTVYSIFYKEKRKMKSRTAISNKFGLGKSHLLSQITNPQSTNHPISSFNKGLRESTVELLSDYFDLDHDIPFPSILFFQVDNEIIIDHFFIKLDEEKIEDSYLELKTYFEKAVSALNSVTDENKKNSKELFALLKTDVQHMAMIKSRKKIGKKIKTLIPFINLFK